MAEITWGWELRELLDACRRVRATLQESAQSPKMFEAELRAIEELAHQAWSRYSSEPLATFVRGYPMSREQYYACRAMGLDFGSAQQHGLAKVDDYTMYQMLCYEDDGWIGFINVDEEPGGPLRLRIGHSPEECRRAFLRAEQHEFFQKYLPDVYERFID